MKEYTRFSHLPSKSQTWISDGRFTETSCYRVDLLFLGVSEFHLKHLQLESCYHLVLKVLVTRCCSTRRFFCHFVGFSNSVDFSRLELSDVSNQLVQLMWSLTCLHLNSPYVYMFMPIP